MTSHKARMQNRYENSPPVAAIETSRYRQGVEWLAIYGALALIAGVVFGTAFTRLF